MPSHPLPTNLTSIDETLVENADELLGIYVRQILLPRAGIVVPQHKHDVPHPTLVCSGAARAWADGVWIGDFKAGQLVPIEANVQHVFQSLKPMTRLACLADAERALKMKEY